MPNSKLALKEEKLNQSISFYRGVVSLASKNISYLDETYVRHLEVGSMVGNYDDPCEYIKPLIYHLAKRYRVEDPYSGKFEELVDENSEETYEELFGFSMGKMSFYEALNYSLYIIGKKIIEYSGEGYFTTVLGQVLRRVKVLGGLLVKTDDVGEREVEEIFIKFFNRENLPYWFNISTEAKGVSPDLLVHAIRNLDELASKMKMRAKE